jgi:hypothetical protein
MGGRNAPCNGCGPAGYDELWVEYDTRGRPYQSEPGGGPGIGPNLKANAGPDRRSNYIGGNDAIVAEARGKEPPPVLMSPLPHPPAHMHVPAMTAHPYEILPFHGGPVLRFPSPNAWTDPGQWNVDPQRIDWRRPDATIPRRIEP